MSMDTYIDPSITFSTSRTDIITGSHEFKITGYSLNKGLGVNKYIESKNFSVGGCEWTIRFYPNHWCKGDFNASLGIALASDATNITASFEFTLLDQRGMNQHKMLKSEPSLFSYRGSFRGCHDVFELRLLDHSDYIMDDTLLIRARVGVVRSITESPEMYSVTVPPSNIGQQFGQLLENGEGTSDIRFKVGRETFAAHKLVLAVRSPVFKAQLHGSFKENHNTGECIEIVDMEATVFKALLYFIYWDVLPDLEYLLAQHLLVAADRYGLERLQLICEAKLCEGITIDNAATTLALAEQHHCSQLKPVCLKFIAQQHNLKVVIQTDGFKHLQHSCPTVLCELMEYVARAGEHPITVGKQGECKKSNSWWAWLIRRN